MLSREQAHWAHPPLLEWRSGSTATTTLDGPGGPGGGPDGAAPGLEISLRTPLASPIGPLIATVLGLVRGGVCKLFVFA